MADMTPPEMLRNCAAIYEQRNKLYGDNYKRFGPVMQLMFPDGLVLKTPEDHNRFGVFVQVVAKVTRYAENFTAGGHPDSLDDMAVYAMMLQELDQDPASAGAADWEESWEDGPEPKGGVKLTGPVGSERGRVVAPHDTMNPRDPS